jgi:excisionase family DNA binding protein
MEPPTQLLPPGEYVTVAEAAAHLHIHRRTAYRFVQEGRLPAVYIGTAIRIPRQALLDMLARSATGVTR